MEKCDKCNGSGEIYVRRTFPTLRWPDWCGEGLEQEACPDCEGTGLVPPARCPACNKRLTRELLAVTN